MSTQPTPNYESPATALYKSSKTSDSKHNPLDQPHTIDVIDCTDEEAATKKFQQLLNENCDYLWHFADEGPEALEWALREKTDIPTLHCFVLSLKAVLISAELVAEERKYETERRGEDGGLVLTRLIDLPPVPVRESENSERMAPAHILVVPTPGTSYEEDMRQRDAAAVAQRKLIELGGAVHVRLHCNLDDKEIRRAVKRYDGMAVTFEIVESDSTADERVDFRQRWQEAGGPVL